MTPDWILVANATHARLIQKEPGCPIVALHTFEHPSSRVRASVLGDAPAGRAVSGHGFGGAAFEPHTDAHRKELQAFARDIAQHLEQAAQAGSLHRLVVLASSPFLGELRSALGPATQRLLAVSHDVDLTAFALGELEGRLAPCLPPAP